MADKKSMKSMGQVLQRLDRKVAEVLPAIEYRKMQGPEDRHAIKVLRDSGYRRSFDVEDGWAGFDDEEADLEVNSDTYGIFIGTKLATTIRLNLITPAFNDTWALNYRGDVLEPKIKSGMVLLEVSRLVVDPNCALQIPELPYLAFRLVAMADEHYQVDECFSMLREKHVPFYQRLFNAFPEGEPFFFAPFNTNLQMMTINVSPARHQTDFKFDSFGSNHLERRQIFGRAEDMPGVNVKKQEAAA